MSDHVHPCEHGDPCPEGCDTSHPHACPACFEDDPTVDHIPVTEDQ